MTTIIIDKQEHKVYSDTLASCGDQILNYFSDTKKTWHLTYGQEEYLATGSGKLDLIIYAINEFQEKGELSFKASKYGLNISEEGTLIALIHKKSKKINLYEYSPIIGIFGKVKEARFIPARLNIEKDRWLVFGSGSRYALGALMLTEDIKVVYDVVSHLDQGTCAIYNEDSY